MGFIRPLWRRLMIALTERAQAEGRAHAQPPRCQWGTCEAEATRTIRYWPERSAEMVGHPDWIFGVESKRVCDACANGAQAELGDRCVGVGPLPTRPDVHPDR